MNKKVKKILIVLLNLILISTLFIAVSEAASVSDFGGDTSLLPETAKNTTVNILGTVLSVIRTVGAAVAICILMVIGCKYIIASAGDRADIKKYALNYVIGAIVLFGASGILGIIQNFVDAAI